MRGDGVGAVVFVQDLHNEIDFLVIQRLHLYITTMMMIVVNVEQMPVAACDPMTFQWRR